jgi:hypothetical protein
MSRRAREEEDSDVLVLSEEDDDQPVHQPAARKQRLAPDLPAGTVLEVRPRLFLAPRLRLGVRWA